MIISPLAFASPAGLLSFSGYLLPAVGLGFCGLAATFFRGSFARFVPVEVSDAESIMNFSSLGNLHCVCGEQHPNTLKKDRRQFCRACGCEVVAMNTEAVNRVISSVEIRRMTRSLRSAAIRASHMELPQSISTVEELHQYLDSRQAKKLRMPLPSQAATVESQQIH